MFTGIIKEIGRVESIDAGSEGARVRIAASFVAELGEGDSVAVDGVCLTAAALGDGWFEADAMNQTLGLTTLGATQAGSPVNLEPALRAGDPLGGHIVQGHVDGLGEIARTEDDGFARRLRLELPAELRPYVIERGSVTLSGVSLTVAALTDEGLEVSLIPETLERTTLGEAVVGDRVNVEIDPIARYVERLLTRFQEKE
ncbi:riboflavin synthase [soil metagenome]